MKITEIDVVGRDIPIADDFPVSYEEHAETDHVFVRLQTDGDLIGYGEGTALPWFTGETTDSMTGFVERWLAPRIEGATPTDAAAEVRSFSEEFPGNPGGKGAVEMAVLDLRAKQAGVPVSDLLGGAVHDTLPFVYPVPGLEPEEAATVAETGLDRGFRRFKIKATGDIDADVARIDRVLDRLPEGATARVDPNTSWENFPTAKTAVGRITDPTKLEYLEQPVAPDRPADLRQLWDHTAIPVLADEFVHEPADVEYLGREGLVAGVHLKLAKTGSLQTMAHMAQTARQHGLLATPVSAFGTSLESSAIVHLAATIPNIPLAVEIDPTLVAEDPVNDSLVPAPTVPVPTGPGLGVELDDAIFDV